MKTDANDILRDHGRDELRQAIDRLHAQYLRLGGIDGFVGDGAIKAAAETSPDIFYSVNIRRSFWFTGDFQHIVNPGFNADRGPVNIFSIRIHGEF